MAPSGTAPSDDSLGLGLSRAVTIVCSYDARWPRAFDEEAARLLSILGTLSDGIEHIGSTAVPGLAAKPVLDVAIAFAGRGMLEEAVRRLSQQGYEWRGDSGDAGGVLVVKGPEPARTYYLHLVELDDPQWRRYLLFRDALRLDPRLRDRYAALKLELAERFPSDRLAYVDGKSSFIQETLAGLTSFRA